MERRIRKDDFSKRFIELANKRARYNRYVFSNQVEQELVCFIENGVSKLSTDQLGSENIIQNAERNIEDLVDLMASNARSRFITESLDITALNYSLRGFCPRFPFC